MIVMISNRLRTVLLHKSIIQHLYRRQQIQLKNIQFNRYPYSSSASNPPSPFNNNKYTSLASDIATISLRVLSALSLMAVTSEYCFQISRCEGPSMTPTILPTGNEIILIERFSVRWYGLGDGADSGKFRTEQHRQRQEEWEKIEIKKENNSNSTKIKDFENIVTWHEPRLYSTTSSSFKNISYLQTLKHNWNRLTSGIQVGDVVVLQHPNRDGTVCKRVLGLPGDVVIQPKERDGDAEKRWRFGRSLIDRNDHRNFQALFNGNDDDADDDDDGPFQSISSTSLISSSLLIVPDGHVWVEGDNSVNSVDSRYYGALPAALIVGKVFSRIWPLRGDAMNVMRAGRPMPPKGMQFTGSTVLPTGYEGEKIVSASERRRYCADSVASVERERRGKQ